MLHSPPVGDRCTQEGKLYAIEGKLYATEGKLYAQKLYAT